MNQLKITALTLTMLVAGCGGGSTDTTPPATQKSALISGSVTGLAADATLLLVNNGAETIAVKGSGGFKFTYPVASGAPYSVVKFADPNGGVCTVANGSGTIAQNAVDIGNVAVTCQPAAIGLLQYHVGVTVSGLAAGNAVSFADANGNILKAGTNGLSVFAAAYSPMELHGASYAVTVSANPTGQACTLTNNTGTNNSGTGFVDFINITALCK
ncbi:hypothetical protein GTP81_10605 [Rugamonas sp. FT107W]|uniref:Uncharacterized protein n=1 Tax=Duganella vulcania TaxID=2692166 RepID=A0A845HDB7_9BURK|nr:hypothetical protein [Duganella vulcania]MYN17202.1 hypothetical protein [Duganella vulcania]